MRNRVAITGVGGLIGIETAKILLSKGYHVTGFDLPEKLASQNDCKNLASQYPELFTLVSGSILNPNDLLRVFGNGADVVFHFAAMLGVKKTEDFPIECLRANIDGTRNVLQKCVECGVKRLVFASSSEVYGEPISNPISESASLLGTSVYAISKIAGEEYVRSYQRFYRSFDYIICRFFNTYGENQVGSFVLKEFVSKALEDNSPVVYGDGTQVRGYCHASDTAGAVVKLSELSGDINDVFNVGNSDEPISLVDLASKVIDVCGGNTVLKPKILNSFENSDREKGREIYFRYCNTQKLKDTVGFSPRVSLDEGIRRIAAK